MSKTDYYLESRKRKKEIENVRTTLKPVNDLAIL